MRMDFIYRYFVSFTLKVMLLTFLQVLLICIPALAFAQLPTVNLTLGNGDASEAGPNPGSFIVSRNGGVISQALDLRVIVTGKATFASDYSTNPDMVRQVSNVYQLIIPPDQTEVTVLITPVQDGTDEGDETVIFTLQDTSAYTVGESVTASITIADFVEGIFKDSFENP